MQLQIILSLDITSTTDYKGIINQSDAFNLAN
jgi:hypothetical protein